MLTNIAIAYAAVGILRAVYHLGLIHGYVRAGQSAEWNRLREFRKPVVVVCMAFYACVVTATWPIHRLPEPGTSRVRFGLGGTPKR